MAWVYCHLKVAMNTWDSLKKRNVRAMATMFGLMVENSKDGGMITSSME